MKDIKEITVREFLRNVNDYFPLPKEGIRVRGRYKDFIVLPWQDSYKMVEVDKPN